MLTLDLDGFGDRPVALDDQGGALGQREIAVLSAQLQRFVGSGKLVLLLGENTLGALAGLLAISGAGSVPLMLGANTDQTLIDGLLGTYSPPFVWAPCGRVAGWDGEIVLERLGFCLIRRPADGPELHKDLALLLPTSGTTGSPKLVRHSHANLSRSARNVAWVFGCNSDDRPLAGLPIHFTMGLSVVMSHLYGGATILLTQASVAESDFWVFFKEQHATSFTGVPYSFELLHRLGVTRMELPHLRILSQGGGRLRDPVFRAFAEHARGSGRQFFATYGQTEGTARMAYLSPEHACERTGSIGKAIPEGRFWLIDEAGEEIHSPEATGELLYSGPNVTLGYAHASTDLAKGDEFRGVLHTGDIARRDKDGFFYIVGRKSRFLKLYGQRVSLDDIERMVKNEFSTECLAGGDDSKLRLWVEKPEDVHGIKLYITKTTGLFHGAVEVHLVDSFERTASGKLICPH